MSVESPDVLTASVLRSASASRPAVEPAPSVADCFEGIMGTRLLALFSPALFDEMMLPMVSASLVDTTRIRDNPYGRARRTAASDQLAFLAASADRREEMERLVRLHRDIKGVTPDGVRYSGLNPEAWNWNLISIFFMHRGAFMALTGQRLDATGDQAVWDRYRALTEGLQMPGRTRELPATYGELCEYYDHVAAERLTHTEALNIVMEATLRPRRPPHMPAVTAPLYAVLGPIFGHLAAVLGFGIMHPQVRQRVPMTWSRRHDVEFLVFTRVLRWAHRWLPRRITYTPLARNRREYERIVARYRSVGLVSFVPGVSQTCGR